MKDVEAFGSLVTRDDIGRGITFGMADVKARARRIRKHIEHIIFFFAFVFAYAIGAFFCPFLLPAGFYFPEIVIHPACFVGGKGNLLLQSTAFKRAASLPAHS
jgi:hypothetical protein